MLPIMTQKKVRDTISESILLAMKPTEIVHKIQEISGLSERMCWKHYSRVKQRWIAEAEKEKPYYLAEAIQVKKRLFSEAYLDKDLRLANDIHNDELKIKGIYSPIQVSDTTTQPLTINIQIVNQ